MRKLELQRGLAAVVLLLFPADSALAEGGTFSPENFALSGYLETFQLAWAGGPEGRWSLSGSVNNRLDMRWYPADGVTAHVGGRTLFTFGGIVASSPEYARAVTTDEGFFDLTFSHARGGSHVIYTNIDRANIQVSRGKLDLQLGRQRVNWGVNLIWNPNDIFNTASYFDFTYVEKPGSDAVRAQFYAGAVSSVEVAAKLDRERRLTAAALFRFNRWKYDFQVFGGKMVDAPVLGGGWSGQIGSAGFNGEVSYFGSGGTEEASGGQLVASSGVNYTFPSTLYLQFSFIYNSSGTTGPAGGDSFFERYIVTARTLTPARYNLFGGLSRSITPLIKVTLGDVYNPSDQSNYLGPELDWSLEQNVTLSFVAQLLFGKPKTEFSNDLGNAYYVWLKWHF